MFRCAICGKEVDLPFKCKFCGLHYCDEHRLPEQHECTNLPPREWESKIYKQKPKSLPSVPKKTKKCVKCGSEKTMITVVRKDYNTFLCLTCYTKWEEFHEPTKSEQENNLDVCVECKTKLNDNTPKQVTPCPLCGRNMCNFHIHPTLVDIPNIKHQSKKRKAMDEIKNLNDKCEGGHPCFPYTRDFWQKYDEQPEYEMPHPKRNPYPKPKTAKNQSKILSFKKTDYPKSSNKKWTIIAIIIVVFLVLVGYYLLQNPNFLADLTDLNKNDTSNTESVLPELPNSDSSNITPPETVNSDTQSNTNTVTHEELVIFALDLINSDREEAGLQSVTLSENECAQLHADDMFENGYLSHWDTDGYKPYMRYTIFGGQNSVSENCATQSSTGIINPKDALEDLQWSMMYDDADSDWGHRENILNPFHNKVSIGITYNSNSIYLVQDFEDDYITWDNLIVNENQVTFQGKTIKDFSIDQIAIYYDALEPLTSEQLATNPYNGGYSAGLYVGMVVPPLESGWEYQQPDEGILIIADRWNTNGLDFNIEFNLTSAFVQNGKGVYTLYMWTESENYLTTYSVWYGD